MTTRIKIILANMYEIDVDDVYKVVPDNVKDEIEIVNNLCKRAGAELVSRQIIADIVIRTDKEKIYNL